MTVWAISIACAWPSRMMAGHPAAPSPQDVVVRLLPAAVVSGDDVTLGDVAEITGGSSELVAGWTLGAAPKIGATGSIESTQIQSMLSRRGVNLSTWIFRGASKCSVTRAAGIDKRRETAKDQTDTKPTRSMTARTEAPKPVAATRPAQDMTLESALRAHITARLAHLNGTPVIRFSTGVAKALTLSQPTYRFQITDRSERLLGLVSLEVAVIESGELKDTLTVLTDITLKKQVVRATRPINRGEIVAESAVAMQEQIFDRVEDISLNNPNAIIGQRATKFVPPDGTFSPRDIEPVPLILRNDLVTVTLRRGGLSLRGSAKAMESKSFGELIQLRNEGSKETFVAVVTGQKQAEVREGVTTHPSVADATDRRQP